MPLRAFMEHNPPTSESLKAQGVETYNHPTTGEEMVKVMIEGKPVELTKKTAHKLGLSD